MAINWPASLAPQRCDPQLRNLVKTGGRTATGRQQRVLSDAGFWEVDYTIMLRDDRHVRAFRAMIARMRAGEQIVAELFERSKPTGAMDDDSTSELKVAAALRDTEIVIYATGINVLPGSFIGIANRMHLITDIIEDATPDYFNPISDDGPWDDGYLWNDGAPTQRTYRVKILPPMRAARSIGTPVEFRDITILGELADLGQGDTSLDLIKRGPVSFTIRESI